MADTVARLAVATLFDIRLEDCLAFFKKVLVSNSPGSLGSTSRQPNVAQNACHDVFRYRLDTADDSRIVLCVTLSDWWGLRVLS